MESEQQTDNNGKDPKTGKFVEGNSLGGRPFGSKNKFTKIKEEIADAWLDSKAKEVLKNNLVKDLRNSFGTLILDTDGKRIKIIDKTHLNQIIAILPKDPVILNEGDTHITYVWSGDKDSRDKVQPSRLSAGKP